MHIVYSALRINDRSVLKTGSDLDDEMALRLDAHLKICEKYKDEINAIRKHLRDWHPVFAHEIGH